MLARVQRSPSTPFWPMSSSGKQASSASSRMLRILLEEAGIEKGRSEKRPDLSRVHKHEDVVA